MSLLECQQGMVLDWSSDVMLECQQGLAVGQRVLCLKSTFNIGLILYFRDSLPLFPLCVSENLNLFKAF